MALTQREPMVRVWRDEQGVALALAIFVLVVVGAFVASAFFAAYQEQRVGENTRRLEQSFGVAEYGLADKLVTWQPELNVALGTYPGDSARIDYTTTATRSGSYGGWVYRLNDDLYMVDVVGLDTMSRAGRLFGGGARQRLGLLARLRPIQVDVRASLTTRGGVDLTGNARVDGTDLPPNGWLDCDQPGNGLAGIRTHGGNVSTHGNAVVIGNPKPVLNDPSVSEETFTEFGDLSWSDLVGEATITLPGGTYTSQPSFTDGVCNTEDPQNWGDGMNPGSPCGSYFPIVYISGDATLNGVQGQGLLLVDGTLNIQGSYEYYGVTIIQGDLKTGGGGSTEAHFWGGTFSKSADLTIQNMSGKATLNYSSCALSRVLQATARPVPMRSRGWMQLY